MSVTRIRDWLSLSVTEAVSLVIAVFALYLANQIFGLGLGKSFSVVILSGISGVIWGYYNAKQRK